MVTGAADSHELVSHFADKCVVVGIYGAVSWDYDNDLLIMRRSPATASQEGTATLSVRV